MNDLFVSFNLQTWKPVLTALLLPPVPFLLAMLVGSAIMRRRGILGRLLLLGGAAMIWTCCTSGFAEGLQRLLLNPPRALSSQDLADLRKGGGAGTKTAIVVLGGGRELLSPEYGLSNLNPISMERLRYAVWLSRETGHPLAFSGGLAPGAQEGPSEAEIATRIAEREFGRPLKWAECRSRDTGENASRTVALLRAEGINRIVLVTHQFHMPRAMRAFERAREHAGADFTLLAAPMGLSMRHPGVAVMDFMPTNAGIVKTRLVLREWLGLLAGA